MSRWARKIKTAASFSPRDWQLLAGAYATFIQVGFLLAFRAPATVEATLKKQPSLFRSKQRETQEKILGIFDIARRYQWPRPKCLATALAKEAWLRHNGFDAEVRIGVRRHEGQLKAHAWCEEKRGEKNDRSRTGPFQEMERLK